MTFKRLLKYNPPMMTSKRSTDVFSAIADANRRKLLDLLAEGERPVQELVAHFDISFAAISQHLRILYQAGLVARRPVGRQRFYRARPERLQEVHEWTARYQHFWQIHLHKLGVYLDAQRTPDDRT